MQHTTVCACLMFVTYAAYYVVAPQTCERGGTAVMLAYVNVYLGCLALLLEMVELAPLWTEDQTDVL